MNKLFNILKNIRSEEEKPALNNAMNSALEQWSALYENRIENADSSKSLNLAAAVARELSRLVTIEFDSHITGGKRAAYLDEQYQRFIKKARQFVEYACAKGGVVFKPYFENGKILVSVIQAEAFYPTMFTSDGEMVGAVFYETFFEDGVYYTRIEEHKVEDYCCIITNKAYKSKSKDVLGVRVPMESVDRWRSIEPYCKIENYDRPLFVYFKMPMANIKDSMSPLGVSAFAGACDLIKDAYKQYSNLLWEFESGKRALFLDECAVRRDEEGNAILPERRLYRMLTTDDEALFEDWSPTFREESILKGLDRILKSIEFNCGLAYGTLSDPQCVDKTAEEIRSSNQRSYATVCDIQNSLKKALTELIDVMDTYCEIYCLMPKEEFSVSFDFDDSIVCDRTAEFSEKLQLVEKGIIAPWEMRAWYFNEDEETARKMTGETNEV